MLKRSKMVALFLFVVLSVSVASPLHSAYAAKIESFTASELMNMESEELLSVLIDNGLTLPRDYDTHRELARSFVSKYTPLIIQGDIDPELNRFGYYQLNDMMKSLEATLRTMKVISPSSVRSSTSSNEWTLQDSTAIGTWVDIYNNYNCYAYVLDDPSLGFLHPGVLSNVNFETTMPISQTAYIVLEDLSAIGYEGYVSTVKPTSLPDMWFRVICVRKDSDVTHDFHFMKMNGSLNSWTHKPGSSQPLLWNYTSPSPRLWTSEMVWRNEPIAPDRTYESMTYYIIYKGKNDPGVRPLALEEPHLLVE